LHNIKTSSPYYVTALSECLAARKKRNARYSLRAFAKYLNMDPSALSRILSGKQELSAHSCRKVLEKLDIDAQEKQRFIGSVADQKISGAASALSEELLWDMHGLEQHRQWFEMAHDAILVIDPLDERVLDANARACQLYGLSREDLLGKSLREFSYGQFENREYLNEALNQPGTSVSFEIEQKKASGQRMTLEVNASVVEYHGQRAILSITRDVTERKSGERLARFLSEAGQQLHSSLRDSSTLARVAKLSTIEVADGCLIHLLRENHSPEQVEVAHRVPETAQLLSAAFSGSPELVQNLYRRSGAFEAAKARLFPTVSAVPELGELAICSMVTAPLVVRGEVIGIIVLIGSDPVHRFNSRDLELIEQFALMTATAVDNVRLFAEALRAVRHRDEFIAVVSHDLKSPLAGVLHGANLLGRILEESGSAPNSSLKRGVEAIGQSAQRMHHMVTSLVSIVKADKVLLNSPSRETGAA
jgi:PAS domain S-box-containing protein